MQACRDQIQTFGSVEKITSDGFAQTFSSLNALPSRGKFGIPPLFVKLVRLLVITSRESVLKLLLQFSERKVRILIACSLLLYRRLAALYQFNE